MVYQINPPGIELYFYANTFFCFNQYGCWSREWNALSPTRLLFTLYFSCSMKTADLLRSLSIIIFLKQIERSNLKDLIKIYPEKESENACTEIGQTRISSNPKTTMTKSRRSLCLFTNASKLQQQQEFSQNYLSIYCKIWEYRVFLKKLVERSNFF